MKEIAIRKAWKWKYPEWIVLVTSIDQKGRPNVMPVGWSMFTSHEPLLYAVSITPQRYTHGLIEESGEFVVAIPSMGMGPAIYYCGTHSGRDVQKFENCSLEPTAASKIKPPLIKGAVANLECRVVSSLEAGDHTIFIGEVVAAHAEEGAGRRLLNFGNNRYAQPQMVPGSLFQADRKEN